MIELRLNTSTRDDFRLELEASLSNEGVTAVFGPSGSGKTTLAEALYHLLDQPKPQTAKQIQQISKLAPEIVSNS